MKVRNKILLLISCCVLITSIGIRPAKSTELFRTVKNYANEGFRAIKYTGITLSIGSGLWGVKCFKDGGIMDSMIPLVISATCAGVGYMAWKLEKWTDNTEKSDDKKQGNENELLHSDSGM